MNRSIKITIGSIGGSALLILFSTGVFAQAVNTWTTKNSAGFTARQSPTAAVYNGRIYAVSGSDPFTRVNEEYDPGTDTWTSLQSAPDIVSGPGYAVVGNNIFVIGGVNGPLTQIYMPVVGTPGTWIIGPGVLTPVTATTAALLGGKIYLIGGLKTGGVPLKTVQIYDTLTNTWTQSDALNEARGEACSAVFGGKIYIFGGPDSTVEVYDTVTKTWNINVTSLPVSAKNATATTVGNRIFVIGGRSPASTQILDQVQIYDPVANKWSSGSTVGYTPRLNAGAAAIGNTIYVFGGSISINGHTSIIEAYQAGPPSEVSSAEVAGMDLTISPNPFTASTQITITAQEPGLSSLELHDMLGNKVYSEKSSMMLSAGEKYTYSIDGNALHLRDGVYFAIIQSGSEVRVRKVIFAK